MLLCGALIALNGEAAEAARSGFALWQNSVMPALLPFFLGGYAMLLLGNLLATIYTRRADKRKLIIGAALFIFSDSLILVRVLCGSFPTMEFLIMGSYYSAQYLLTFSHRP